MLRGVDAYTDSRFIWSPVLIAIGFIGFIIVLTITISSVIPFRVTMPVLTGSARVILDACYKLREPLHSKGIQLGGYSNR